MLGTGQGPNDAAAKGAQMYLSKEECAKGMGQIQLSMSNYSTVKAQTKKFREEGYVGDTGRIASHTMNLQRLGQNSRRLPQLEPTNQRAPRAAAREGQEGSRVPQEVAILCQDIIEWLCGEHAPSISCILNSRQDYIYLLLKLQHSLESATTIHDQTSVSFHFHPDLGMQPMQIVASVYCTNVHHRV